jgi:hypothetical protein
VGVDPALHVCDEPIRVAMAIRCDEHAGGVAARRDEHAAGLRPGRRGADGEGRVEGPDLDAASWSEGTTFADEDQVAIGQDEFTPDGAQDSGYLLARLQHGLERDPRVLGQSVHGRQLAWAPDIPDKELRAPVRLESMPGV